MDQQIDNGYNASPRGKEQVKSALKDLKDNYKHIENQIDQANKRTRKEQQTRYQKVMELIESLKQSLKTEISNRKETEDQFMQIVDNKSQQIESDHTLNYLNHIYAMKEQLTQFDMTKTQLQSKLVILSALVEKKLVTKKTEILDNIETQKNSFSKEFRANVDKDASDLKQMGELQYNFEKMMDDITARKELEVSTLNSLIEKTVNDENVYQKEEATRKLLLSQVNFLKERIKMEICSRQIADEDIQKALDQYKGLIQETILHKRNDIKNRD